MKVEEWFGPNKENSVDEEGTEKRYTIFQVGGLRPSANGQSFIRYSRWEFR